MSKENLISKIGKSFKQVIKPLGLAGLLCLARPRLTEARIIHVPADSTTIQAGINGAQAGDTVKVAPGTFYENNIILKDSILMEGASPDSTIIDGGGAWASIMKAANCEIRGFTFRNSSLPGIHAGGTCPEASPIINNNKFTNLNTGVFARGNSSPIIHHNVMVNNGCGIYFGLNNGSPVAYNNTIVENIGKGIYLYNTSSADIFNNIVVRNERGISAISSTPTLSYNDVWGNSSYDYSGCSAGTGSISADPLFVDSANRDYHLTSSSPCIDAGDLDTIYNDPDSTRNDIGAFYFHQPASVEDYVKRKPLSSPELKAFPNPFTHKIKLYKNKKDGKLEADIYDVAGRLVKKLDGNDKGIWDGKNSKGKEMRAGLYFIKPKDRKDRAYQPKKVIKL